MPAGAKQLIGRVALDDSSNRSNAGGSVVFRVLVARGGSFAEAWTSGAVRTGQPPQDLTLDTTGAQAIALLVEPADRGDTLDHADWLGLRFVP